ncbi:MAG: hypothetical protein JW814_01920 [Candidatus Krumholzibacteriota bacterium]|nr:hypothetical protein [Candidatus Krumholzibacteriota bacterium]
MRLSINCILLISMLALFSSCSSGGDPVGPAASTKEITAFSFLASENAALAIDIVGSITGTSVDATVPAGTDVTELVASFTTTGESVRVSEIVQVSGATSNDFSSPVTYTVVAEDGSTQDYTVTVAEDLSAKEMTTFGFLASDNAVLASDVVASIAGSSITAYVPMGTDVTALVASFTTTGASVRVGPTTQISGTTANDFSSPAIYTVVASDASTQDYTVTITESSSAREITSFSFLASDNAGLSGDIVASIVGTSISATIPIGTDESALVASFTTTGESVLVGPTTQVSGVTANDFSSPVIYTVVAEDASTRDYTVTVNHSAIWIGNYTIRDAEDMAVISGYTEITGYLQIISDLTDVNGLTSLTTVGGFFQIYNNMALIDLSGLSSLTSVGGRLEIYNNDALTNLTGLGGIITVGESLEITGNDLLVNLGGLSGLTTIGTFVEMINNASLNSISGLSNLTSIGGSLVIERNPVLTSLAGLEQITALGIGEYDIGLEISGDDALTNLTGLDNLASVTGGVQINGNDLLASLDGLGALASVGEYISINGNPLLATLAHLTSLISAPALLVGSNYYGGNPSLSTIDIPTLESTGRLSVESNTGLVDLSGLSALANIGDLEVNQNAALTTLGFGSAAATPLVVTGEIEIFRNSMLEDLGGIEASTALDGFVKIIDNPALNSLAALNGVVSIESYLQIGSVDFNGNPSLPDLGFTSLETVGGYLTIEDNDNASLTSLTFGNLQSVGEGIHIRDNANLLNLAGLDNLTAVNGSLEIEDNVDLISLSALDGITSISGNLVIDSNISLDNLLGLDDLATIGYNLVIANNHELDHLDNLGSLTSVGASLEIDRNYTLDNLDGLAGLTTLGSSTAYHLYVLNNSLLRNTDGIRNIHTVGGPVWINYNGVTSIDLSSLQAITGALRIQNNTNLTTIDMRAVVSIGSDFTFDNTGVISTIRFDALNHVGRHIYIRGIQGLTDLSILAGFAAASDALGGDLILANNTSLSNIDVLSGFTEIGNNLDITNNDNLASLDPLAGITSIGGSVWVRGNSLIPDLGGLALVASIGGLLMIDDNPSLTALGLDALASLTYDLYVRDNASLCADLATDLRDQLLSFGWARTAYLSGNTGPCP